MEVEKCGEELVKDPEKLLPFLLVTIDGLFSKLEASIGHLHAMSQVTLTVHRTVPLIIVVCHFSLLNCFHFSCYIDLHRLLLLLTPQTIFQIPLFSYLMAMQGDSSIDESCSFPLLFEKLPEVNQEGSQWTDCEIRDSINLIYQNLRKLDVYLSHMVWNSSIFCATSDKFVDWLFLMRFNCKMLDLFETYKLQCFCTLFF